MSPMGVPLAEWWQRLAAIVIDGFILVIPVIITGGLLQEGAGSAAAGGFGALLVATAYYGLLNGSDRGQTLGKMALGIQVRDAATGGPIGPGRGALRYVVIGAFFFLLPRLAFPVALIDGLWPLWDPQRQALHDKVVGSLVVRSSG